MAKSRNEVLAAHRWRLEDIFRTEADWDAAGKELEGRLDFSRFEGKLGDADTLLACFRELDQVSLLAGKVGIYAFLRHDEDTRNDAATAALTRVELTEMKLGENTAFITPELTALPEETLRAFIADPRFSDYDYSLASILRKKPHVRSREVEELLSQGSRVFGGFSDIFDAMDDADFKPPFVNFSGEKTEVSHGMYGVILRSHDRAARRSAFKKYYQCYIDRIYSLAATYIGNVDKDVFFSRVRRYPSCLARAMDGEDVDVAVYDNLLACVHEGLPLLHRYYADLKQLLGYRTLHMYDLYCSPVEGAEIKVDYEEAFGIVKEGLAPLGADYGKLLDRAHDEGWIDVEETAGKTSGAYSISTYGLPHPYVLLNYQPTTGDVFTIAHELGHAMHSYHSEKYQPQDKSSYTIFVAEVASTVNEVLLLKHLLGKTTDKKMRKYLLSYYMDTLKGTLFRQTQFAEFESIVHQKAEQGEPLTKELLCEIYYDLNKKYYGDAVESDKEIAYEWARIPHFYRSFYVYKYATGITAAVCIAERILKEGEPAVKDYFRFLSSGGSDKPTELLKLAGVDLTDPAPFAAVMASFRAALEEFETL